MLDLTSYMPEVLQRSGPLEILWWQWIALPVLIFASFIVGHSFGRITRWVLSRAALRTTATWDDAILLALVSPLRWAWSILVFRGASVFLGLDPDVAVAIAGVVRAALFLCFFWFVVRVLDESRRVLGQTAWAQEKPVARSLVPLAVRSAKVVVLIIALISMLSQLGYPVAGLIAGVGIGGIALALAAQKTVENLFGAFSIGLDQPFREGDFVKLGEFYGHVEAVGLRSTRIRTLDRTVVTIPNSQVAESKIESYAERDRFRLFVRIGLVYQTSGDALRAVLAGFTEVLRADERFANEEIEARFVGFGASSLDVEVIAWYPGRVWAEFKVAREQVLMKFVDVVAAHGSDFAYPTQTVHLAPVQVPAPAPAPGEARA